MAEQTITRADYMAGRVTHQEYYIHLAEAIGLTPLRQAVGMIARPDWLADAFKHDQNLNNIPLHRWDGMHEYVLSLVKLNNRGGRIMAISWDGQPLQPGFICWSLSESVCVLKAVARMMVEEARATPG